MGNIIKLSAILFFVAGIASASLAFYNSFTKPEIEKLKAENEMQARKYVLKGLFEENEMDELIFIEDSIEVNGMAEKFWKIQKNEQSPGYAAYVFLCKGQGFSGVVETMVGTDTNFNINTIKVIKHSETPGLGAESQTIRYGEDKPFFETWFEGKNSQRVVVIKDDPNSKDKVQSITGATITTRAVCVSINKYTELIQAKLKETPLTIVVDPEQVISVEAALKKAKAEGKQIEKTIKQVVESEETTEPEVKEESE